jgi:hypothetical protein
MCCRGLCVALCEDSRGEGELDDLVAQVPDLLALLGDGPAEPGVGLAEPGFLAVQRLQMPEPSFRLDAIGHGPDGVGLAERLCRHADTWGSDRTAKPAITIYPHAADRTAGTQAITREHCEMTVTY